MEKEKKTKRGKDLQWFTFKMVHYVVRRLF